jgi:hypothetical protein
MVSSEVQRTLVKSPPELWAELSDPGALARHLGELGEIRIVRVEPESTVEWTAENTTGTVFIKPSGWGTNVKLTVVREIAGPAPEPQSPDVGPQSQPTTGVQPEAAAAIEPQAKPEPAPVPVVPEPLAIDAIVPEPVAAEPVAAEPVAADPMAAEPVDEPAFTPRRGFFARLFGRRRARAIPNAPQLDQADDAPPSTGSPAPSRSPEPSDPFAAVREALAPETLAASHPYAALPPVSPVSQPEGGGQHETLGQPDAVAEIPAAEARPEPLAGDISAELMAAEEVAAEEVTAVLTAVLDRLGAAHHRPFSRA